MERSEERLQEARERGERAGQSRASWVFDGNTTQATYRAVFAALEDGDDIEGLEWSPLSGEWAGESENELIGDLLDGTEADDAVRDTYEESALAAYWAEVSGMAARGAEEAK